jgi:hypothetical protein
VAKNRHRDREQQKKKRKKKRKEKTAEKQTTMSAPFVQADEMLQLPKSEDDAGSTTIWMRRMGPHSVLSTGQVTVACAVLKNPCGRKKRIRKKLFELGNTQWRTG